MLKKLFTLYGRVIRGARIGKRLGFPTANLDRKIDRKIKLRIHHGVYAGIAAILPRNKTYRAGIVIGPLDKKGLPKIEAHLLNFSGNLYGKRIRLAATRYLRRYKFFKKEEALKKAIANDLKAIRLAIKLENMSDGASSSILPEE